MKHRSRHNDLQALGLVDWTIRPDGALGATQREQGEAAPVPAAENDVAGSAHAGPSDEPGSSATRGAESGREPMTAPVESPVAEPATSATIASDASPDTMDWSALEAYLARQDHRGATHPVFGVGARDADVLIVGEAPGANEDAQGVPFVGRAGKLLDRMLFAIGCSRETNVYITNICKFRPPDNRDPTPEEVAADWPILERQIDLMAPRLVVAVGRIAAQTLLDSQASLSRMRGHLHSYPQRELSVLVTYHPAYLLRSPQQKLKAWDDLRIIARHIGSLRA